MYSTYVCIHVCTYVCTVHMYISMYVHMYSTYASMYAHTYVQYICTCIHVCTYVQYIYIHVRMYIRMYSTCICIHVCTYVYVQYLPMSIRTWVHTYASPTCWLLPVSHLCQRHWQPCWTKKRPCSEGSSWTESAWLAQRGQSSPPPSPQPTALPSTAAAVGKGITHQCGPNEHGITVAESRLRLWYVRIQEQIQWNAHYYTVCTYVHTCTHMYQGLYST